MNCSCLAKNIIKVKEKFIDSKGYVTCVRVRVSELYCISSKSDVLGAQLITKVREVLGVKER
jgi:hypothetical protein